MPEKNVTLTATSTINKHDIIYKVNGEVVKTYEDVPYDTALTDAEYGYTYTAPEGYTFSGWNETLPASMPDHDVIIEGTTTVNKHTITYEIVGDYFTDSEYKVIKDVAYGTELSLIPDDMTKTGYTFHGWSGLAGNHAGSRRDGDRVPTPSISTPSPTGWTESRFSSIPK